MTTARRPRWQGTLRSAFAERLALKAAALFFALVLWMVVSIEEPTEDIIPVRFAPVVDSGIIVVGPLPTVRAMVLGRGRELLKLYNASPVIVRRVSSGTSRSSETVSLELGPADVDLPSGVSAVVRDVRPRVITLQLRRIAPRLDTTAIRDATPPDTSFATDTSFAADSGLARVP